MISSMDIHRVQLWRTVRYLPITYPPSEPTGTGILRYVARIWHSQISCPFWGYLLDG